jgi:CRISPR/Cas system CSM-associated protein Csm3 (group 7 of RAMP superfamily)
MTPLWHNCPQGNSFGMWDDEPQACRVCRKIEQTPQVRYVYDDYDMPPTLVNRDTFPELHEVWTGGNHERQQARD